MTALMTQHRMVLTTFACVPDERYSSDGVCWREDASDTEKVLKKTLSAWNITGE